MNCPEDLKYTRGHEGGKVECENAVGGITECAQSELGDIVFVDIPSVGDTVAKDEVFGTVEAVKTVADLFMPLSGEVLELNEQLDANPELVNQDPYGKGWMVKIQDRKSVV